MTLDHKQIAFIGGGHITEIIIDNLTGTELISPEQLIVSNPTRARLEALHDRYSVVMATNNQDAASKGDYIFINVQPTVVDDVIEDLRQVTLRSDKVLITLAAGIPLNRYTVLGDNLPVARALPNPPSQIGQGIAALAFNAYVTETQKEEILEIFKSLGEYVTLKEDQINVVTALSSPAAIFLFFQALNDAGVRSGIDRKTSTKIAYQTIVGSMAVWNHRQVPPYELMSEASTPGGISVECLFTLEKYAFKAAISEAIYNGTLKANTLGKSQRSMA